MSERATDERATDFDYTYNNTTPLKVFMYDLPAPFQADTIEAKYLKYLNDPEWAPTNCDLARTVCREATWRKQYSTMRQYAADMTIIKKFENYPHLVTDPTQADIFVVPYPHSSDCRSPPQSTWFQCERHVEGMVKGLVYLTPETRSRHLFLLTGDLGNNNPVLEQMPLFVSLGGSQDDVISPTTTNIVVPPPVLEPEYQPSELDKVDWTRPRKYSIYMNAGLVSEERKQVNAILKKTNTVGGLLTLMTSIAGHREFKVPPQQVWANYRNTMFCPVIRGDLPYQKRFFDVALSGCLPVVLVSPSKDSCRTGCNSWWKSGAPSWAKTHPFANNGEEGRRGFSINYLDFVVEVQGGANNMVRTLEKLMKNQAKLRAKQLALGRYARALVYGLGDDMHAEGDAFEQILGRLEDHLERLSSGSLTRPVMCAKERGCVGLGYVVNVPSVPCTPKTMLTTLADCKAARVNTDTCVLSKIALINTANAPKGCFSSRGKWHFNTHATGGSNRVSESVCRNPKAPSCT